MSVTVTSINVNNARKIGVSLTWLMILATAVYNLMALGINRSLAGG